MTISKNKHQKKSNATTFFIFALVTCVFLGIGVLSYRFLDATGVFGEKTSIEKNKRIDITLEEARNIVEQRALSDEEKKRRSELRNKALASRAESLNKEIHSYCSKIDALDHACLKN